MCRGDEHVINTVARHFYTASICAAVFTVLLTSAHRLLTSESPAPYCTKTWAPGRLVGPYAPDLLIPATKCPSAAAAAQEYEATRTGLPPSPHWWKGCSYVVLNSTGYYNFHIMCKATTATKRPAWTQQVTRAGKNGHGQAWRLPAAQSLKIATWNTNSMPHHVLETCHNIMAERNISVLGVTESHHRHLRMEGPTLVLSAPALQKGDGHAGVAIILRDGTHRAVMGRGHVGAHHVWCRLRGTEANYFILVSYIPCRGRKTAPFQEDGYAGAREALKNAAEGGRRSLPFFPP